MSKLRGVTHHVADTRRTLKGHSAPWLRAFIGTRVIRILTADDALDAMGEERVISPAVRKALSYLQDLALEEENA